MKLEKTNRGFSAGNFNDKYGNECSIQKSSIATDDYIWLGINNPKLTVFENEEMGQYVNTELPKNWRVDSRMLLSVNQVKELLPILNKFVNTGEI